MVPRSNIRGRTFAALAAGAFLAPVLVLTAGPGQAASSDSCAGGGFRLVNLTNGATVATSTTGEVDRTIPAADFGAGAKFGVRGRYISYDVRMSDFAVLDYAFTGAANPEDITGGGAPRSTSRRSPTTGAACCRAPSAWSSTRRTSSSCGTAPACQ